MAVRTTAARTAHGILVEHNELVAERAKLNAALRYYTPAHEAAPVKARVAELGLQIKALRTDRVAAVNREQQAIIDAAHVELASIEPRCADALAVIEADPLSTSQPVKEAQALRSRRLGLNDILAGARAAMLLADEWSNTPL
jgi:hypothetical protein